MLHFLVKLINNRLNFDLSKNNELQIVVKYGKYNLVTALPLPAVFMQLAKQFLFSKDVKLVPTHLYQILLMLSSGIKHSSLFLRVELQRAAVP